MNETNEVLMTTITIKRFMDGEGREWLDVDTDPQVSVSEVIGMLAMASNEIMNGEDE